MKILFEHADYFTYTKDKEHSVKHLNCLIARVCMEEGDADKMETIIEGIKKIYFHLKPESLALFPFAHLSSEILDYRMANSLYKLLATQLAEHDINVITLPFGTNKGYELSIKEHKLNNIFRHY